MSNSESLDVGEFGRQLVDTGDLDPVYTMLASAALPGDQLRRWLVAYWCCYHAGASSWMSEHVGWDPLVMMAHDAKAPTGGRWPRGRERRHFRGSAARQAVAVLRERFQTPEALVDWLAVPTTFADLKERVLELPLFGPWIAFKIGDMLERLLGVAVSFDGADIFIYAEPLAAAHLVSERYALEGEPVTAAINYVRTELGERTAPPGHDRPVGLQEIETVLCKWKAHQHGHYPVGIDTKELRHALTLWAAWSPTAVRCREFVAESEPTRQEARRLF